MAVTVDLSGLMWRARKLADGFDVGSHAGAFPRKLMANIPDGIFLGFDGVARDLKLEVEVKQREVVAGDILTNVIILALRAYSLARTRARAASVWRRSWPKRSNWNETSAA